MHFSRGRDLWQTPLMKRPAPIKDPTYNLPSAGSDENATPAEKALAALKVGAIAAAAVTIVLIYISTYGGLKGQRDLISLAVVTAFLLPSVIAYLLALRADRRRPKDPEDDASRR
jgi:hypothetical protein